MSGPPPPPPPPIRPGGGPPPPPMGARPPQGFPMQMPIRQQSTRIQNITPQKMLDSKACLKKLTTYAAYTFRKCAPQDPKKENSTWAVAEVTEERLAPEEVEKQINKLEKKKSSTKAVTTVTEKKAALKPFQQGQISTLLDNLGTNEQDKAFEWSLVQIDSDKQPLKLKHTKKGKLYETVTMTVYVRRAPRTDLDPVMLFQNIERIKAERMRPPPPQQHPPHPGPPPPKQGPPREHNPQVIIGGNGGRRDRSRSRKPQGRRPREKNYHGHRDDSTVESSEMYDSDTASTSSTGSSSMTSQSSRSRDQRRRSKGPYRSHSRHAPRYVLKSPIGSPRVVDAYGGIPAHRPHAPEVPQPVPTVDPGVIMDAYQAGKQDALAERYGLDERLPAQAPVLIQRNIESRPTNVVSYPRPSNDRRYSEQVGAGRYPVEREPRYSDDRYVDEIRRRDDWEERQRHAEEYIERVPLEPRDVYGRPTVDSRRDPMFERSRPLEREYERRPYGSVDDHYVDREFVERRRSPPSPFANPHPFAPNPSLRRAYPPGPPAGRAGYYN